MYLAAENWGTSEESTLELMIELNCRLVFKISCRFYIALAFN